MATTTLQTRSTFSPVPIAAASPLWTRWREPLGAVLVATEGSPESDAAVRVAAELARERGARPEVLTVVDPLPPLSAGLDPIAASAAAEVYLLEPKADRLARITRQLSATDPACADWPIDLRLGVPAALITDEATQRDVRLVVMGVRSHTIFERVFRDETTLRVMRRAAVPVLAVTRALTTLPTRVTVGVDFSRASMHAAQAAASLVADGGTLSLVHVQPQGDFAAREATEGLGVIYVQGVAAAFARLRAELRVPPDVRVETSYVQGDSAAELLDFVERTGAELLAVGSQRHSAASRMLLGSVTTSLTRAARCSLLVTPPAPPVGWRAGTSRPADL